MTILLTLLIWDCTGSPNCQVVYAFGTVFTFLTMSTSSLLIVLRIIAIWNKNKVAMAISISVWGVNVVLFVQLVFRIGLAHNQLPMTCVTLYNKKSVPNPIANNPISFNRETNPIAMLITDIVLLLIMLVGLFRLHRHRDGSGTLAQALWKQGVIWLLLIIVALVPSTVFMILYSDGIFSQSGL